MKKLLKRIGEQVRSELEYQRAQKRLQQQTIDEARVVVLEPEAPTALRTAEQHRDVWRNLALTLERYLDATAGPGWREHYAAWVREQGASNGPQPS